MGSALLGQGLQGRGPGRQGSSRPLCVLQFRGITSLQVARLLGLVTTPTQNRSADGVGAALSSREVLPLPGKVW